MHGSSNFDDLGLENPFQSFAESERSEAESTWSGFGESPFTSEQDLAGADSPADESLDWLDYEGRAASAERSCACGAGEAFELEDEVSSEHLAFRAKVLERVLRDRSKRAPFHDVDSKQLAQVPRPSALAKGTKWTSAATGKATAEAAGRLLEDAHQALLEAQSQGDADAKRTLYIYPNSGYRSAATQEGLWLQYFSAKGGYYDRTAPARAGLPGGPHSAAAVDYMVRPAPHGFGINGKIAPPGYSNHQNAIALDFQQVRRKGHEISNKSTKAAASKWKASWFHRWLLANAARHGFVPLATEAWHWEFKPQGAGTASPKVAATSAPKASKPTTADFLGGRLLDFRARAHGGRVAVFAPAAARGRSEVDVVFFVHGLLNVCKPVPKPAGSPVGLITQEAFRLGKLVTDSGLPIVVVVPFFDWGAGSATALASPTKLNALLQEVLEELGRAGSPSSIRQLVVAGHSRAYGILDGLATRAADPAMQQGGLAKLSEVWALDTSYGSNKDVTPYTSWLAKNPRLTLRVFYRPGSSTDGKEKGKPGRGHAFFQKRAAGRLEVVQCSEGHCAVPVVRLPDLLSGLKLGGSEAEAYSDFFSGDDEAEYEADFEAESDEQSRFFESPFEEAGNDEAGDDEAEYEAGDDEAGDDEAQDEDESDEAGDDEAQDEDESDEAQDFFEAESDESFETQEETETEDEALSDDEEEHGAWREMLEDESESSAQPLPVPQGTPIEFAPEPAAGAFWPIVTSHPKARVVCYKPVSGSLIGGSAGRIFLAKRSGTRSGKRTPRWHLGVDLFAKRGDSVFACEDGTVVAYAFFYKAKSGQKTYKILVAHEASGVVANYGEVRPKSLEDSGLKVGSQVRAGQRIGWVSDTDMIHFELYRTGTKETSRWWADQRAPSTILNPTRYLLALAQRGRPPGAGAAAASVPSTAPKSSSRPVLTKGTSPAWTALIDTGRELDAATIERVRAVRAAYPERNVHPALYGDPKKHNPKVHRGYTHAKEAGSAHNKWCIDWLKAHVIQGGSRADLLAGTTFRRLFEREGGTPDLNLYDNQIVTWGTGFGGQGSLQDLFVQLAPTEVGRILAEAGLIFQTAPKKPGRYHVVNLETRKVVSSDTKGKKRHLAPLEAIRRQDSLLYLLIGVAVDPATRGIVLQEMWQRYKTMAGSFKGIDQIHGTALFSFVSHMHLWYPKFALGGLSWALTQVPSGASSAERDLTLAGFFAHYFLRAAEVFQAEAGGSYAETVLSRLPGNPWKQFREDRVKDGAPPGPEKLSLKLGGGSTYPSVDDVKRFWKSG